MGRSPYGNSMSCSKDVSSSGNPHHHSHSHHHHQQQHHHSMLKKGAWTPEEDQKLIDYINEHGHGNWRALPKKCGLMRCGKSCRLRWTNYLRPDIKRGAFAPSEEQKIIQLHALVGNRWAFIASQLPKRTDNEIKNYWNTVLKKRTQKPAAAAAPSAITMGGTSSSSSAMTPESLMGMFAAAAAARNGGGGGGAPEQANSGGGGGLDINMWMYSMQKSASKPPPNVAAAAGSGSNHLAQWETARLEAEARLAQQSKAAPPTSSSSAAAASAKPKPQSLDWLFRFNLNSSPPSATAPPNHSAAATKKSSSGSIFSFLPDPDGHDISRHFNAAAAAANANNNSASSSSETAELSVAAAARSAKALQQQQEGGGSMKYHAATTSAIKLGSNGRLSWNKHELSLPSLTCVAAPPLPPPPPPPPSNSAASILLDCLHSHSSPPPEDRHDIPAHMKPSRDSSMLTHVTAAAAAAAMENMIHGGGLGSGTAAANSSSENGLSNLLGNIAPNLHDLMMEVDTASCSKSMRSSSSSINDSCIKLSQLIDSKNNNHHNHNHNHNHQSSFNVLDFYSILSHGGHSGDQKSNPNLLARSSNNNNILMESDPPQTQTRNGAAATPSSSKLHNTSLPSTHHSHNLIHSHNLNSSNFQLLNHAFDHAASINQLQGLNFQQIAENLMLGEPNVESQFNNLLMDLNLC